MGDGIAGTARFGTLGRERMRRGAVTHHDGLEVWVSLAWTLGGAVENESMPPLRFWKRCEVLGDGEFPSQHGAGRAEEGRAGAEARGIHATMRSSRPRGGGRHRAVDHPFPLVPRDPDDLDRRHEHLRISTAYLASMTNDPRELNAAHVAAAAQTPDATEVLTSLGTYLGVPGFEPTTSGRPTEEAPPPLRKGVLPEVSPGDHDAYLEKVAGWEAFTRANADRRAREADEGGGIHPGVNGNCDANGAQQLDQASSTTMKTSSSMSSSSTALVAVSAVADVRARDHSTRHAAEKVPAMYFDPCFDLSDPAVFRAVCPDERTSPDDDRSSNTSSKGGPEQRATAPSSTLFGGATGLATQERLSQHLDKVEIKLVGEIGARSESFFEASARLHELDAIVSETCGAIRRTRRSLLEASTYATCAHESVTSLHRKRANLRTLTHVFEALSSVRECREDLDVLVAAEDCGGALEVCEEIRRKVSDPTLAGLACLKDVAAHVDGVEQQVVSSLVLEFTRAARVQPGSVGHPGDETGSELGTDGLSSEPIARRRVSPGDGWGPATTRAALDEVRGAARDAGMENVSSASEDEEDDVSPSDTQELAGLGPSEESVADVFDATLPPLRALTRGGAHRTGRIGDAMRAWGRDAAFDARACIRRACLASLRVADATVLGVQSVDMDGIGSNYSANSVSTEKATYKAMETLPAEVFAAVIRAATHALAGHFARAELVRSAAQYALGTMAKDGGENTSRGIVADDVRTQLCASLPPGERASASAAASDAVLALADASQGAMAKILASRASTNARLTLREFSKICDAAESFLAKAESLSGGRRCLSLRGALNTQCKDFMSVRHAAYAAKLGSVLESETWTAVSPVPGEYQRILDAGFEPCVAAEGGAEGGADTAVHDDDDTAVRDALVLPGDERVVPVGASLALLKMCADHLAVARRVPSLGPVAVYKIAELLRVFNSRTSQLVLGAGSMRTAGLRSITAKHLALAQQSVRLFLEVTPAVSAALSPTLPDTRRTQLLSEFTSTVRDLEKHKTELQTKMVSIARDRLVYHSARLPTIWCSHIFTARKASSEEGAADLAEASSEFATALGKEVGTLRRVIAGTLSNEDATCVLNEVLRVFDEGLTAALAGSKESTANEWRAKMGSPTKPKPAVPMDDSKGGAEEGAEEGADTAVHDDDGEETEETTVKSAAPSNDEVNGLIGRDGGALLGTLGTLVNGGTGGDGACGAPTLAKYLLEYRS